MGEDRHFLYVYFLHGVKNNKYKLNLKLVPSAHNFQISYSKRWLMNFLLNEKEESENK